MEVRIIGQSTDKAKVLDWHDTTLALPPASLTEEGRAAVAAMTAQAEATGYRLHAIVGDIFQALATPQAALGERAASSAIMLAYWRSAERAFRNALAEWRDGVWSSEQVAGVFAIRLISAVNGAWEDGRAEFGEGTRAIVAVAKYEGLVAALARELIPAPAPRVVPFTRRMGAQLDDAEAAAREAADVAEGGLTPAALADQLGVTRRHVTRIAARLGVGGRQGEGRRAVWSLTTEDVAALRAWFAEHGRARGAAEA